MSMRGAWSRCPAWRPGKIELPVADTPARRGAGRPCRRGSRRLPADLLPAARPRARQLRGARRRFPALSRAFHGSGAPPRQPAAGLEHRSVREFRAEAARLPGGAHRHGHRDPGPGHPDDPGASRNLMAAAGGSTTLGRAGRVHHGPLPAPIADRAGLRRFFRRWWASSASTIASRRLCDRLGNRSHGRRCSWSAISASPRPTSS